MRWTKGRHAFIVSTHVDKVHIHSHIIFNSTTLDCTRKFRDFRGSGLALQRVSDRLCLEHGLSIVENPKGGKRHYGKWLGDNKKLSFREKLRLTIDAVLAQKPADFEKFLRLVQMAGYEIRTDKRLSFRKAGQKTNICLRSLGKGYSEEEIRDVIADGRVHARHTVLGGLISSCRVLICWWISKQRCSRVKAPVMSAGPKYSTSSRWRRPSIT